MKELDAEGSLTLYGMAVIAKDAKGNISTKAAADAGPLGTAVGTLVGGLLGVIGGPVGSLAGAAGGALIGSVGDLFDYGVGADFVEKVAAELAPGKAAIIAEIGEDWTTPLDTQMETFGGTVLRTWRADFEDDQIENEIAAERAELAELKAEHAQAKQEVESKACCENRADEGQSQKIGGPRQSQLDALHQETQAKIAALEKQFTGAREDAREKINHRIAALRARHEKRAAKLKQAGQLTKEALAA